MVLIKNSVQEEDYGRGNIKRFNALKDKNPKLKTLAAIGGWNEGSKKYSAVSCRIRSLPSFSELR